MNDQDSSAADAVFLEKVMRYQDGAMSAKECAAFENEMRDDAAKRRLFAEAQLRSMALHERFRQDAFRVVPKPKRVAWFASFVSRPFAAAAAGLVLGLFCATLAWAVASPRAVATMARVFALADGSFEMMSGKVPSGFPQQTGVWSGDESEVVTGGGATPKDGARMLRFVRAEGDATVPNSPANSCDVWQLVDLRGLRAEVGEGEATLELSASFLDARKAKGSRVLFSVRVYAFAGEPSQLHADWPMAVKESLAFGSGVADAWGGAPQKWKHATAKMMLPSSADFAVVQLVATKWTTKGQTAEFGEQFADDVRLTLKTQPKLPVRVASR